jgi:drug/metabolite transporter (DMT)-like permease
MSLRVWFWLLSLSVLWGGSFFFAKVAVAELGPLTVAFGRVALAAIALNVLLASSPDGQSRQGRPWWSFFVMGFLNNALPFSLIFWAQTHIASGLASILNATTPLCTVVAAHFFTPDEKITAPKITALLAGFMGVVVLIGPAAFQRFDSGLRGDLACVAAAFSYGLAGVFGRRFKALGIGPMEAAAGQVTASSLLILPIMAIVERPWMLAGPPSVAVWLAVAGLALLSTALAYILYFRILAAAGATNLLLVTLLIPVTSILLGAAFLDERLSLRQAAGMALIGVGLLVIDGRMARLLRPAK